MSSAAGETAHPLGPRFEEALSYALAKHGDQRRKGTAIPYAAHLLAVAAIADKRADEFRVSIASGSV